MSACCGEYHLADCPLRDRQPTEPGVEDHYDAVEFLDIEPFPGCCAKGDYDSAKVQPDDIGGYDLVAHPTPNHYRWTCIYCGTEGTRDELVARGALTLREDAL